MPAVMSMLAPTLLEKRKQLEQLRFEMRNERESFISHWRELNDMIWPRRGRFYLSDVNRGGRRNKQILDGSATYAARTLRSGLMSGMTNPSRPWFELTMEDFDIGEDSAVKVWLHLITERMRKVFLRSNLYKTLPVTYVDMSTFATGCVFVEQDERHVLNFQAIPIGSYSLATDHRGVTNTFVREFAMTVDQVVRKFGMYPGEKGVDWANISPTVQNLWQQARGRTQWINVAHVVRPNDERNPRGAFAVDKEYESTYYELGPGSENSGAGMSAVRSGYDKFLRVSGYDYFPVLTPRWGTTGSDVYGTDCPGMDALGDIKQLQSGEKRILQGIDRMVDPPLRAPTSAQNTKISTLPGDISYFNLTEKDNTIGKLMDVDFRVDHAENKQASVRSRINEAYYTHLFRQFIESERRRTATEASIVQDEKFFLIGPMVELFNFDMANPLIDIAFSAMNQAGLIPPAPEEIQGRTLAPRFISAIAQAQQLSALQPIDRTKAFYDGMKQTNPTIQDIVNEDEMLRIYAKLNGVAPSMINDEKKVREIRAMRAQQQRQQQQREVMREQAETMKTLSDVKTDEDQAPGGVDVEAMQGLLSA